MIAIDYHSQSFVDHTTSVLIHALAPVEFHNDAPLVKKVTVRCTTVNDRKPHIGELLPANRINCTLRGYTRKDRSTARRYLVRKVKIDVTVHRVTRARTFVFEDFSGSVRERPTVQLNLNPR